MSRRMSQADREKQTARRRRVWDKQAPRYDRQIGWFAGGRLVLVDHIRSASKPVFLAEKLIEFFSIRIDGDHMTRRPSETVRDVGFEITEQQRFRLGGILERLTATKPAQ